MRYNTVLGANSVTKTIENEHGVEGKVVEQDPFITVPEQPEQADDIMSGTSEEEEKEQPYKDQDAD